MNELNIFRILNVPASPDFNAIETCFAQCKRRYKKERVNALVNEREFDVEQAIADSLDEITPELVKASTKRSIYLLHNTIV